MTNEQSDLGSKSYLLTCGLFTQHSAELFLGAMDTTFLLAYAVVRN